VGANMATLGEMDDSEIDLRLDPPRAGSHTVTLGEPNVTRTIESSVTGVRDFRQGEAVPKSWTVWRQSKGGSG
jgi:hypothetical protein